MATHKQDLFRLSLAQLSQVTGKAYNTLKRLLVGLEPVAKDGRTLYFDAPAALAKIYQAKEEQEKDRLDRLRADQIEFDLAVKRGEYAPIEAVKYAIGDMSGQVNAIFEGIPKRIKQSMPSLRAREMKILERELVKAENAIAEINVAFNTKGDS